MELSLCRRTSIVLTLLGVGACAHVTQHITPPTSSVSLRWVRIFTDTAFTVELDTSRIEQTPTGDYLLWLETRWALPHQTRAPSPFNRETIHTLLRCKPLAYKTVRVSVSLNAGPIIAEEGGSVADALATQWKVPKAGSADLGSFSEACTILQGLEPGIAVRQLDGTLSGKPQTGLSPGLRLLQ